MMRAHICSDSLTLLLHQNSNKIIPSYILSSPSKNYSKLEAVYQYGKQDPYLAFTLARPLSTPDTYP